MRFFKNVSSCLTFSCYDKCGAKIEVVKGFERKLAKRRHRGNPSPEWKSESERSGRTVPGNKTNNLSRCNGFVIAVRYLYGSRARWWDLPLAIKKEASQILNLDTGRSFTADIANSIHRKKPYRSIYSLRFQLLMQKTQHVL